MVAAMILPHVAFAGEFTLMIPQAYLTCLEDGASSCSLESLEAVRDMDPFNSFEFSVSGGSATAIGRLFIDSSKVNVNKLEVVHQGDDSGTYCTNFKAYTSSNNVDWNYQGNETSSTKTMFVSFATDSNTAFVKFECLTTGGGSGWDVNAFNFYSDYEIFIPPAETPEMGVWALLIILPIMGYVVYKSAPMIRPTAV